MKLVFLPHVREGLVPSSASGGRGVATVGFRLESPGHAALPVSRSLPLLGPGDVVALDTRQVLRVTPTRGTRDAEVEFFPAIEFDAPDLPWAYSPAIDGTRVMPWLTLIVLESRPEVTLIPGQPGQSPWFVRFPTDVAARELPDLTNAWAWAHAQVACEDAAQVETTLRQRPDRTLSRLIAPRRLLPFRSYLACVVPVFDTGRRAGLGLDGATGATGMELAWSSASLPGELPVYYSWAFSTGEAGDFESLAGRLHGAPADANIPPTPLSLILPDGEADLIVDWEPPLRAPGRTASRPRRPQKAVAQIKSALSAGGSSRRVLGPAYFGEPWTTARPLTPMTAWAPEVNLTPMLRAAAGLGAEAVRTEQEALVSAASEQLDQFKTRQREGRRRQFATAVVNRVRQRLAAAPARESARVFAPLSISAQWTASNAGMYSVAGRRLTRKEAVVSTTAVRARMAALRIDLEDIDLFPVIEAAPVQEVPQPPAPPDPTTISTGSFSPRFSRPMNETLAERHPELMLPGAGSIETDGVMLVESDPAFIAAFLLGANQEINYELLWRGLPSEATATPFRRFWDHRDGGDDIGAIADWNGTKGLGAQVSSAASMILLVRSELIRRYPSLLVAAVPAEWKNGARVPVKNAALVLPAFRGQIGEDVLYAGFTTPSIDVALGSTSSSQPAGWFFLLSENPGDPRFGLDPDAVTGPPTRTTLRWGHLSTPDAPWATASALPAVPDAAFTPAQATAASIAMLVRQRPFRAYLHASLLLRPRA